MQLSFSVIIVQFVAGRLVRVKMKLECRYRNHQMLMGVSGNGIVSAAIRKDLKNVAIKLEDRMKLLLQLDMRVKGPRVIFYTRVYIVGPRLEP